MEASIEVPSYFLCPISLQIMRDPVTLSTGITYDRDNIEKWIFAGNHPTCPLTKQPLAPADCVDLITPNTTLRRLIQAWCAVNASQGIERFPTPRPPVTRGQIVDLIEEALSKPQSLPTSLHKLKSIVAESERNRRCVQSAGVDDFLASVIENATQASCSILDDAVNLLYSTIHTSERGLLRLLARKKDFIDTLITSMRGSTCQCRAYSALLIKSLVSVCTAARSKTLNEEFFVEIVNVLRDRVSYQATKAAMQILMMTTEWGRNKITAVEAGAVRVLIEILMDDPEKKVTEAALVVLSRLTECAEGRAEVVGHAAGVEVVCKKMVRVSVLASERAVKVMHLLAKSSATEAVLREMLEVGMVSKLCLLIQVDCGPRTKERVKEMLSMHARLWRNSPCIAPQLQSSYPAHS